MGQNEDWLIYRGVTTHLQGAPFIELRPVRGYYSADLSLDVSDLITVRQGAWALTEQQVLAESAAWGSPTLHFTLSDNLDGDEVVTLHTARAPNAYSRYAQSDAGREVAQVFDVLAAAAPACMHAGCSS